MQQLPDISHLFARFPITRATFCRIRHDRISLQSIGLSIISLMAQCYHFNCFVTCSQMQTSGRIPSNVENTKYWKYKKYHRMLCIHMTNTKCHLMHFEFLWYSALFTPHCLIDSTYFQTHLPIIVAFTANIIFSLLLRSHSAMSEENSIVLSCRNSLGTDTVVVQKFKEKNNWNHIN